MANLFIGNRDAWSAPPDDAIREPLLADAESDDYDEEQPEEPKQQTAAASASAQDSSSERPRPAAAEQAAARPAAQVDEAVEAHLDDDLQRQQDAEAVSLLADRLTMEASRLMTIASAAGTIARSAARGPFAQPAPSPSPSPTPPGPSAEALSAPGWRFHFGGGGGGHARAPSPAVGYAPVHAQLGGRGGGFSVKERCQAAWRRVKPWLPTTPERSQLAYAALLAAGGTTGLFCIPLFPLVWQCAGLLPVFSVMVLMMVYSTAFMVSLLPEPRHLLPGFGATLALLLFYCFRFGHVDKFKVRGPRSLGDVLFGCVTVLEVGVLGRAIYKRWLVARARRGAVV